MAAVQFFLPYDIAIKPTNVGAPGAKLYVYTYNTTTLRPVYATSALTTQLTNPVVADGAGRFPAIYLDNSISYKIVIKDKLGATLYTRNPYIPGAVPDSAALAPYQAAAEAAAATAGISAGTATAAAGTATTQAGLATGAAMTATTQAGIATAEAVIATTQAGIATTAAALSSSSYNAISAAIAPGSLTNAVVNVASRAVLKALSTVSGLPVHFDGSSWEVVAYSGVTALVAADTAAEGIYVRSTYDTAKVWVRKVDYYVNPIWWGVVSGSASGANGAANDTALAAMESCRAARATPGGTGTSQCADPVRFPLGWFEFSSTWVMSAGTAIIEGCGTALGAGGWKGTTLKWPAGVSAISIQFSQADQFGNYLGSGVTTRSSSGTLLRGLTITGGFVDGTSTPEGEYHGIFAHARFRAENLYINNFQGDGFHIDCSVSGTTNRGNGNDIYISGGLVTNCRDGAYYNASDANACVMLGTSLSINRRWGVNFNGNLDSYFAGLEIETNGTTSFNDGTTIGVTRVFYGTADGGSINATYGVISGQETGASTNAPSGDGTDNTWWYFQKTSSGTSTGVPHWVSGIVCRAGGSVHATNANSTAMFYGCYQEGDQANPQITAPATIHGGSLATIRAIGTGQSVNTNTTGQTIFKRGVGSNGAYTGTDEAVTVYLAEPGSTNKNIVSISGTASFSGTVRLQLVSGDMVWRYANSTVSTTITGPTTANQFGTGAIVPHAFYPGLLMVGPSSSNARLITNGTAAPTSGAHARGEVCYNRNATVGSPVGWMCTVAGTPGTWVAMANL